jgi:hypothetical protein
MVDACVPVNEKGVRDRTAILLDALIDEDRLTVGFGWAKPKW